MTSLQELIKKHHNPSLVDKTKAPNGNRQILLFNDGEIMDTKGGEAFLQRSMFSLKPPLNGVNIEMPRAHGKFSFAIVKTLEIANELRDKMAN